ncbi:MAG TPA: PVC-type heme-binding CxxCH protein [Verrucomicrobiae bacterium]|nr:PVC-type heme-binding CxxCH protein [Verrucomicrobiae bacterium]
MRRFPFRTVATAALLVGFNLNAAQFKFSTQTFTVPDGFEVEQIAGPPVVDRPISGSFDEQGRFYVTDSSGSNDKVEKQEAEKPHRVLRLEPADPSGHFLKSTVFAQRMMFPEGCLWFDGSLYVSAPPSIWKLTGTDADGQADQRLEWHQGKTLTGCANDLHGPYLGLDGWIYWCKGAFARQTYDRPGRKPLVTRASHIFRAPADHADLEPVLTAGMDNPVGVVFALSGERFMCGTFLMHPEAGKRDGIVHAVYGGVYGKSNDVLEGHPKTGELMPIMTHLGAAAPCSVIRYESDSFGPGYQNSLFVCCFNLHKVTRHQLEPEGATFKTTDSDFLVSDNTDFHPTDVIEDADGSLIVIDTGAWYKLCCPTSQLSKPDVLGAIYRIRRSGASKVADPRGLAIAWDSLNPAQTVQLLSDARPAVRKRALFLLGKMGGAAVPPLKEALQGSNSPEARADAVWALTRIDTPSARDAVRVALEDPSQLVTHAAIHSASLWRDKSAEPQLLRLLASSSAPVQRVAAEALGRIGDKAAVPALLKACAEQHDRVLEHSLTYALIEIDAPAETLRGLAQGNPTVSRLALIALDQMDQGGLVAERIAPLLSSSDSGLRQTAVWIASHHPDWGDALSGYFSSRLSSKDLPSGEQDELKKQLAEFSPSAAIQDTISARLAGSDTSPQMRKLLLEVIGMSSGEEPPSGWILAVASCLAARDEAVLRAAVNAAAALNHAKKHSQDLMQPLLRVGNDTNSPDDLRLQALAALTPEERPLDPALLPLLLNNLDPAKPVETRGSATAVLSRSRLTSEQLIALAERLQIASPLEASRLLDVFAQSSDPAVGIKLVDSLQRSKSRTSLRADTLEKVLAHYPQPVPDRGKALLASVQADLPQQRAHLDELMQTLGKGDIRRGQALFNSQKAACSSCHAMGYLGGHVGPDLTSIGQVRTERDLLESIVYPSASFVRSFEPYVVRTKSDDEYSGVLRKDAPDEIVLATGPVTEVRLARADIADIRPGTVSVMPAGLEQQLTRGELADLIAFLKATKWGAQ